MTTAPTVHNYRRYLLRERHNAHFIGDHAIEGVWQSKQESQPGRLLPVGFPSRSALAANGYTTREDLDGATSCELLAFTCLTTRQVDALLLAYNALLPIDEPTLSSVPELLLTEQTLARTFYVSAAIGSDANDGLTSLTPFATLTRVLLERRALAGTLRAAFVVHVAGAGPYLLPSTFPENPVEPNVGRMSIIGQTTAISTGSFSGNINLSTWQVPVHETLTPDAYVGKWVHITSGSIAGARFLVVANGTNSFTVANNSAWSVLGTVNGDTYDIIQPLTEFVSPTTGCTISCHGQSQQEYSATVIQDVHVTGGPLQVIASSISLLGVRFDAPLLVQGASVFAGEPLIPSLTAHGIVLGPTQHNVFGFGMLAGCIVTTAGSSLSTGGDGTRAVTALYGGRFLGANDVSLGGSLMTYRASGFYQWDVRIICYGEGIFQISSSCRVHFAVLSGSAIRVARRGYVIIRSTLVTGGTVDVAGYGIDASGGGICNLLVPATLTGGTVGNDCHTDTHTNPVANFASAPFGISDPDIGSNIARIN